MNNAIITLNEATDFANKDLRIAEMRVLRAHFYFELMKNFGSFVYIDENTPISEVTSLPNSFDEDFCGVKLKLTSMLLLQYCQRHKPAWAE
ncbi:MAG: hypothetical protein H6573_10465 [Lewinellaceae bacterium]|nr:hypothetical protein [Lewinellaceae bacterium]